MIQEVYLIDNEDDIKNKFDQCIDDSITKDAGEYVVSELARETLIAKLS